MNPKRKICVVVASRANYGRIKSLLHEIDNSTELELEIVLSASVLLRNYGNASDIIKEDGFDISASVYMVVEGGTLETMVKSTGMAIMEFSSVFARMKPDMVLTVADRYETIATAIASSYMNIPLVHTQGGELTGSIDESVRHAITKLAHIHFPATELSKKRLIQMGENEKKIFNYGCPSIDEIANEDLEISEKLFEKYSNIGTGDKLNFSKPYVIVLQHSVTNEYHDSKFQILQTIEAVKKLKMQTIWLWPNIDAGTDEISKELRILNLQKRDFPLRFFINFPIIDYAKFMKNASCFIGNSSSALREGAFLGVPSVNIGSRQSNRERGRNVMDVDYDSNEIYDAAMHQINHGKYESDHIFGDGTTSKKMVETLKTIDLDVNKTFFDLEF
ncbi:MAG: UDP-N-acetylglucosamine 2-epimerase (hydrolyzing) [Rhodobacteraceae bacterium TMED111]|nr:MAG: UDP-N-acetylglucosamine 2-epimerase (hydrolyzing) [Rhodobacteraceae bacterium TMED111]|tara:strand:- start:1985 stop:3154 length:1170 start_codon:yes stop_codon:yes gene_type:complete